MFARLVVAGIICGPILLLWTMVSGELSMALRFPAVFLPGFQVRQCGWMGSRSPAPWGWKLNCRPSKFVWKLEDNGCLRAAGLWGCNVPSKACFLVHLNKSETDVGEFEGLLEAGCQVLYHKGLCRVCCRGTRCSCLLWVNNLFVLCVQLVILLSCMLAFCLNYTIFLNTSLNSPLTQTMCGNIKVTALSICFVHLPSDGCAGRYPDYFHCSTFWGLQFASFLIVGVPFFWWCRILELSCLGGYGLVVCLLTG